MTISLIAAVAKDNAIGIKNTIPWKIKEDMDYFKNTTMGKTIIMGRKTYESIGRPLPGRKNVVLTSSKIEHKDIITVNNLEDALKIAKENDTFIIGGKQIYNLFMPYADLFYLNKLNLIIGGCDTFLDVDFTEWELISEKQGEITKFCIYKKK